MTKCVCGMENPENSKYCQECGNPVFDESTPFWVKEQEIIKHQINEAESKGFLSIYNKGFKNIITMTETGLKTNEYKFTSYSDILSIELKKNLSKDEIMGSSIVAIGLGISSKKTVEIKTITDKWVIQDIDKEDASKFVLAVRQKIMKLKTL